MRFVPYQPRNFRTLGEWQAGDLRLKAYEISTGADGVCEELVTRAARTAETQAVPAAKEEGECHGLGFAILHVGTSAIWLLTHWWAHNEICCLQMSRADPDGIEFESVAHRPLMACVWELQIIKHEGRAWRRTMLSETHSPLAYLADRLPDGRY